MCQEGKLGVQRLLPRGRSSVLGGEYYGWLEELSVIRKPIGQDGAGLSGFVSGYGVAAPRPRSDSRNRSGVISATVLHTGFPMRGGDLASAVIQDHLGAPKRDTHPRKKWVTTVLACMSSLGTV